MMEKLNKEKNKSSEIKVSPKRTLTYLGWGCLATMFQTYQFEEVAVTSIIRLAILNTFLFYLIDFFLGKIIYPNWWANGINNRFLCACSDCEEMRTSAKFRLLITKIAICASIVFLVKFAFPITTNLNYVHSAEMLEKKLKQNYITPKFSVVGILNREFVRGKNGRYYKVTLNDVLYSKKILFEEGKYTIDQFDDRLLIPMNVFLDSVYNVVEKGYKCELFVKGSADFKGNEVFKRSFDSEYGISEGFSYFTIYPKFGNSFIPENEGTQIEEPITNSELPNLREKFLQYIFSEYITDLKEPVILEGDVTPNISSEDRNGYLYMYVDWESKKIKIIPTWLSNLINLLISLISISIDIKLKKWLKIKLKI